MVLDASVIVALILREPGYQSLLERIGSAAVLAAGAPTVVEATMVLSSRIGREARSRVAEFLRAAGVEVVSFTEAHAEVAFDAFLRFGKGRHKASLNFGDCLAYATARIAGLPLLYTGDDFSRTDLKPAPASRRG